MLRSPHCAFNVPYGFCVVVVLAQSVVWNICTVPYVERARHKNRQLRIVM